MCPLCLSRGKTWRGDDAVCAFDASGKFSADNWNCATMNQLRGFCDNHALWSNDEHGVLLPIELDNDDWKFLLLMWYKSRGKTDRAILLDSRKSKTLTLKIAEEIISQH